MHQILYISELLQKIFIDTRPADLAVLARTCKTFKGPALDLLWEELTLSTLPRCLPDAFRPRHMQYGFSRPLNAAEQDTLRSYACRIRVIHERRESYYAAQRVLQTIFNLAPLHEPLFPNLRSLYWESSVAFSAEHVAVPSLTSVHLHLPFPLPSPTFFDVFADRCPHMKELAVHTSPGLVDVAVSHAVCRWSNLFLVDCKYIVLDVNTIAHLSTLPNLRQLSFMAEIDAVRNISYLGSKLVFSSLADLCLISNFLDTVILLLSHIQLPATKKLTVTTLNHVSSRIIYAYWDVVQEACPSIAIVNSDFTATDRGCITPNPIVGDGGLRLTMEHLLPCIAFSELRELHVNLSWCVSLTDTDLLQLASPRMEKFIINDLLGWGTHTNSGRITLTGLVQALRQCPSLNELCVAIDTVTFTEIPEGLDVSFPPRKELLLNFADSYILPEFVEDVVSVFRALKLDASMFMVWETLRHDDTEDEEEESPYIWSSVQAKLPKVWSF